MTSNSDPSDDARGLFHNNNLGPFKKSVDEDDSDANLMAEL